MRKALFMGFTFYFCYAHADLFECLKNQERLEKIEQIDKELKSNGLDTSSNSNKSLISIGNEHDLNLIMELLKEKYTLTKDEEEKKNLSKLIDDVEFESSMREYMEKHSGDSQSSETDKVGGLRD